MARNMNLIGIGALSAVLMAAVVAGCAKQDNNPDNASGAPTTAVNTTTTAPQVNSSGDHMSGKGMVDNMGGMGKHAAPNGKPMPGGGMGGDR